MNEGGQPSKESADCRCIPGEVVAAQQALAAAQDSPQKHYGQALLAIVTGKNDDAKKELLAVLNGWDPALRAYARTLQSAYDEFALFPESPPIHLTTLLSRALAQVQECELALPLLNEVLQQQDDYRDAWTVQGYCELTTERTAEALASFQKAYGIDPEKPEIQYFLGRTYIAMKQWKNASTFLQYALANGFEPKKEARRQLALASEEAGDHVLALDQLRELLTEPDADLALFKKTVELAISLGKVADAEQYAAAAVKKWPASAEAQALVTQAERAKTGAKVQ
jgi:predicted Zn-dependent protease